ncbi:copper resistance D family protein [Pseudonocardia nigra]|uniref:copper resistance D family protein n=1 Tax=Pseudonocardia nigra TaxID=1921578 RepID=UPI001C5E84D8|nr:CopD family protein [Pseudonocardia nigra]
MTPPAARPHPAVRWLPPVGWAGLAVGTAVLVGLLTATPLSSAPSVLAGIAVTRSGMDVAGVACVGLALLGVLLPGNRADLPGGAGRALAGVRAAADRAVVALSGAWLVLVLLGVAYRTADAFGRPVHRIGWDELTRWSAQLAAGRGMVLTAGCVAVVLGCAVVRLRDPGLVQVRVVLIAALLGVITPGVTGHAGTAADHQLAVITMALHVGAAALWVGGLAAVLVLVARHRPLLDAVLPGFSRLAGICIAAVTLTGVVNAVLRVEGWAGLVTTPYGLLVLAKSACLVLLACLGGLARRRLATGRLPVLRWAGLETALMALTLGLAAALAQSA